MFDETQLASKTLVIMKKDFGILYSSLRRAMKKQDVSASDLLSHLRDMETFGPETDPIVTSHHCTLRIAMDTTVKRSPTIDDVFHLMAPYCSWFNHLLIESIVEVFFEEDKSHLIHRKLQDFKQKFNDYCHTRHFPLEYFGSDEVHGTTPIVFKIDHHWEIIQVGQLINVRTALAAALKIRQANILLRTVRNGCLELTVAMPTHLAQEFSPLPERTIAPLKECKTVKFTYEHYSCNISSTAEGIEQSRVLAAQVAKRLHLFGDGFDTQDQTSQFTVGDVVGAMFANIGESSLPEFFEPPKESEINVFITSYAGPLLQYMCYLVPAILPLSNRHRVMAGLFGSLCSAGLIYCRWQKYPHNISVKQRATTDLCGTIGTLVGTIVGIHLGIEVETGNFFVFFGSLLGPIVFKCSRYIIYM